MEEKGLPKVDFKEKDLFTEEKGLPKLIFREKDHIRVGEKYLQLIKRIVDLYFNNDCPAIYFEIVFTDGSTSDYKKPISRETMNKILDLYSGNLSVHSFN